MRGQTLLGGQLYLFVLAGNFGVEVFDRGRQIAGQHFTAVVIEGHHGGAVGIHAAAKQPVFDDAEGMGHHGYLQAVFGDVFRLDVAHQGPAVDEFHAGEIGEKVAG